MKSVLFSIPVHERPDIVKDQIQNIKAFCPGSIVCIHVSRSSSDDLAAFRKIAEEEGAIVNPVQLDTGNGHSGIFHVHCSNYRHALDIGADFHSIALLSSNEMLIRPGLESHILERKSGCQTVLADGTANWHLFNPGIQQRLSEIGFLDHLGVPSYFGGQAEGQFYRTESFALIEEIYGRFFSRGTPPGFEAEEVIPPTIIGSLAAQGANISPPITLCDYCHDLTISPDLIEKVLSGRGVIYALKYTGMLASPHIGWSSFHSIFSVKRVPREECELRTFIRGLANSCAGVDENAK